VRFQCRLNSVYELWLETDREREREMVLISPSLYSRSCSIPIAYAAEPHPHKHTHTLSLSHTHMHIHIHIHSFAVEGLIPIASNASLSSSLLLLLARSLFCVSPSISLTCSYTRTHTFRIPLTTSIASLSPPLLPRPYHSSFYSGDPD
jgi:hypothetical protein